MKIFFVDLVKAIGQEKALELLKQLMKGEQVIYNNKKIDAIFLHEPKIKK